MPALSPQLRGEPRCDHVMWWIPKYETRLDVGTAPDGSAAGAESSSCAVGELLHTYSGGQVVELEHGRLERRTPSAERLDDRVGLRLHDKMDVRRSMRPEADIHLGCVRENFPTTLLVR